MLVFIYAENCLGTVPLSGHFIQHHPCGDTDIETLGSIGCICHRNIYQSVAQLLGKPTHAITLRTHDDGHFSRKITGKSRLCGRIERGTKYKNASLFEPL